MVFCCNVGESENVLEAGYQPPYVSYRKCSFFGENEVLYDYSTTSFKLGLDPFGLGGSKVIFSYLVGYISSFSAGSGKV